MNKYTATVEFHPSEELKEQAIIKSEFNAFLKALPKLKKLGTFKKIRIISYSQRLVDYDDLAVAKTTIEIE